MSETANAAIRPSPAERANRPGCYEPQGFFAAERTVTGHSLATAWHIRRTPGTAEQPPMPAVDPGQLWLVELRADSSDLSPLEYRALTSANVVIYDRALTSIVAAVLPLGGYAEPAVSSEGTADKAAAERCLRFALDGWSVVRVVDGGLTASTRIQRILLLSRRLLAGGAAADLPIVVCAGTGGRSCEILGTQLGGLGALIDGGGLKGPLTIVFDAIGNGAAPPFYAVLCNGLAG